MAIPFDYTSEYKRKLRTPEEAARVVKSGDWLDISMGGAFPSLMDEAIAKRKDELRGVKDPGLSDPAAHSDGGVRSRPGALYL